MRLRGVRQLHGSTAKRPSPQRVNGRRGRGGVFCWLTGWLEQSETEWKKLRSPPVSKKSEGADAHKTARQPPSRRDPCGLSRLGCR